MPSAGRRSVADMSLQAGAIGAGQAADRSRALAKLKFGDIAFRALTRSSAILVLLLFVPLIAAVPYFVYVWRTRGMPRPEALATD